MGRQIGGLEASPHAPMAHSGRKQLEILPSSRGLSKWCKECIISCWNPCRRFAVTASEKEARAMAAVLWGTIITLSIGTVYSSYDNVSILLSPVCNLFAHRSQHDNTTI